MTKESRPRSQVVIFINVYVLVVLQGCATFDTAPFGQFAGGLREIRDVVSARAAADSQAGMKALLDQIEEGELIPPDLQLEFVGTYQVAYTFSDVGAESTFLKLARLGRGLGALNDAMVSYADLLVAVAKEGGLDGAEADRIYREINANIWSAAEALSLERSGYERALVSAAGGELLKRGDLRQAIVELQPSVVMFSEAVHRAVSLMAVDVQVSYDDNFFRLVLRSLEESREEDKSSLRETTREIMALNQETESKLGELKVLSDAYSRIPRAHASLVDTARGRPQEGLLGFAYEVRRLRNRASSLGTSSPKEGSGGQKAEN